MRSLRNGSFIKWFYFGMHIKRWLLLLLLGVAAMGLGFSYLLREVYVSYTFPDFFYYLTLQFLPRYARGALFIAGSTGLILFAVWRLNASLLSAFIRPGRDESLVTILSGEVWRLAFPAFFISVTMFAFNAFGDGLRDALDPRQKR